ncbi:hypothetical protein IG631_08346 [Alternaria alternata]|nr:hypothetical protein IG631_08346 [Alternaria alternata]
MPCVESRIIRGGLARPAQQRGEEQRPSQASRRRGVDRLKSLRVIMLRTAAGLRRVGFMR